MEYLFKASGLVILLFLFYYIFLKKETFFKSIRSYFLIGLIIVISIPLIEIPVYVEQTLTRLSALNYQDISSVQSNNENTIDWSGVLTSIYVIGVVFFSIKFLVQIVSLGFLLSKHQLKKQGKIYFVETSKKISPFSFFNIIIFNKSQFTIDELQQIINHEKAHVLQWHSLDTLLSHILVITLWFNPFVWLYKKAVQQNLEFLADAYALELAKNEKLYQLTLLKTCTTNFCTEITNNFYNSLIKKRIVMLHKNRSKTKNQWKYALLLPLLLAFVFTFNTKAVAQEKELIEIEEVNAELIIDKNSTDEGLKKEENFFKKEFDIELSFKGIKRNADNEITAIKINAEGKGLSASFHSNNSKPIQPIKIEYDSENNSISIHNAKKIKEKHISYRIHTDSDDKNEEDTHMFITTEGKKTKWVHKGDTGKTMKVKVIELKDGEQKEVIINEDSDVHFDSDGKQHVYVISGDTKHKKITKKGNFMFINSDDGNPLIIIDGKEANKKKMEDLNPDNIKSIEVLKGEKAIEKYGKKAKDGAIVITTKK